MSTSRSVTLLRSCRVSVRRFLVITGLFAPFSLNPTASPTAVLAHGTAEVIIVAPGMVFAAADSKEVSHTYLSDGTTELASHNSCKVKRTGNAIVMAAGFVRANDFNALDYIRGLYQAGDQLRSFAGRVLSALPKKLSSELDAVYRVGDARFRKALTEANALEVALIGMEDGVPGVVVIAFMASRDETGSIAVKYDLQRCPGDCPNGRSAYFLGTHASIDKAVARNPAVAGRASMAGVTELITLEYAGRPDIVGGPRTLVQADREGVRIVEGGACTEPLPGVVRGSTVADAREIAPVLEELDRRIAGVTNLVCHQTLRRRSITGRSVREDVVEADLRIAGNSELYTDIRRNGRAYNEFATVPGAWASGDLVTILRVTRQSLAMQGVTLESRTAADGIRERGAGFELGERAALWKLVVGGTPNPMAFQGAAWFAEQGGGLRSIEWKSVGTVRPERLNIAEVSWKVDFSAVEVAGESFVAPATAAYAVTYRSDRRREDRTYSVFSSFRRFAVTAQMLD